MSNTRPENAEVVGRYEPATVIGTKGQERVTAKIDTGSDRSTIDQQTLESIGRSGTVDTVTTRSGNGTESRAIVCICVELINVENGIRIIEADVSDRSEYTGELLIGADLLTELGLKVDAGIDNRVSEERVE